MNMLHSSLSLSTMLEVSKTWSNNAEREHYCETKSNTDRKSGWQTGLVTHKNPRDCVSWSECPNVPPSA